MSWRCGYCHTVLTPAARIVWILIKPTGKNDLRKHALQLFWCLLPVCFCWCSQRFRTALCYGVIILNPVVATGMRTMALGRSGYPVAALWVPISLHRRPQKNARQRFWLVIMRIILPVGLYGTFLLQCLLQMTIPGCGFGSGSVFRVIMVLISGRFRLKWMVKQPGRIFQANTLTPAATLGQAPALIYRRMPVRACRFPFIFNRLVHPPIPMYQVAGTSMMWK